MSTKKSILKKYIEYIKPILTNDGAIFFLFSIGNFLLFFLVNINESPEKSLITNIKGDAVQYLELVYNVLEHGTYALNNDGEFQKSALRLPGFLLVFYPFALIFSNKIIAVNSFIVFQTFLSSLAKTLTAKVILRKTNYHFYIFSILILLLPNPLTHWNNFLYTESISSSLITIVIFLFLIDKTQNNTKLFGIGLLFTLVVLLRPFCIPFYLIIILFIFKIYGYVFSKKYLLSVITFLSSFIFIMTIWTYRNYNAFNEFIPLETSIRTTNCDEPFCKTRQFITKFGGKAVEWDEYAEGTWFANQKYLDSLKVKRPNSSIFPNYIFNDGLNIDSLKVIQEYFSLPIHKQEKSKTRTLNLITRFHDNYKKNHFFKYHFLSRYKSVKSSLYQPGSSFKSITYPYNVILTFLNSFSSITTLTIGILFVLLMTIRGIKHKKFNLLFLTLFPIFLIFVMNLIFQNHEGRGILLLYNIFVIIIFIENYEIRKMKFFNIFVSLIILVSISMSLLYTKNAIIW